MLARWVGDHATQLTIVSYMLAAISLLFGTKLFGRFDRLKKRGAFYSSSLVGIVTGLYAAGWLYAVDAGVHFAVTGAVSRAIDMHLSPEALAGIGGFILGLMPALLLPERFGAISLNTNKDDEQVREDQPAFRWFWLRTVTLSTLSAVFGMFVSGIIIERLLLGGFGWFPGFRPPLSALWEIFALVAGITLAGLILGGALILLSDKLRYPLRYRVPVGSVAPPVPSAASLPFGAFVLRVIARFTAIVASIVLAIALIALGVVGVIVGLPFYILFVYLAHEIGWAVLAFVAVYFAGGAALLGLQIVSGSLGRRALTIVFAAPGVVAAFIGFFANFPDLLRPLPW